MGRKIPGRKHRGVKDPVEQNQLRLDKLKIKINAPPKNPDHQDTPKSLLRIMQLKDKVKNGKFNRINKKKNAEKTKRPVLDKDGKLIPSFKPNKNESTWKFLKRVNDEADGILREHQFEDKFNVDIKRDQDTGKVIGVEKKKKHEVDVMLKTLQKEAKKSKNKKKTEGNEIRLTKSQKRAAKLKEKKLSKCEKVEEDFNDSQKDEVGFGEIVHAPPELKLPKVKTPETRKPGAKDLLLKQMMDQQNNFITGLKNPTASKLIKKPNATAKINQKIDKKGKRKLLPKLIRKQLEQQRDDVVKLYKTMKNKSKI